jgi:hypothetical protein
MRSSVVIAAAVFGFSCKGEPFDPSVTAREVGIIVYFTDTARFTLPATAPANQPFQVVFDTFGGGCHSKGETEILMRDLTVDLVAFTYWSSPLGRCTLDLQIMPNVATLTFPTPGTAYIRILGRSFPDRKQVSFRRTVTITP